MAKFSFSEYEAQQAERQRNSANNSNGNKTTEVHFMGEFLKNDGDIAVVRFPYHTVADVSFESTHSVTFPEKHYPSRVACLGDNCPICAEGGDIGKTSLRFFVKALVYVVDESGHVKILNTVWDRPSAFADIDIKNLISEYGDLSKQLFKIKRNGVGQGTRYTISIVMNQTVYNPEVYRAEFSELQNLDPSRILCKTVDQYNKAFGLGSEDQNSSSKSTINAQTEITADHFDSNVPFQGYHTRSGYSEFSAAESAKNQNTMFGNSQTSAPAQERPQKRYSF